MNKRLIFIILILSVILCRSCSHLSSNQDLGSVIVDNKNFVIDGTVLVRYNGNARHVTIPDGITIIGDEAFKTGSLGPTSIIIPESVTSIGNSAFSGCQNLTSIIIPESVTSIGDSAFSRCRNLTSITVNIQNPAYSSEGGVLFNKQQTVLFQYPNGKQESVYTIPASVTSIGDYAFSSCSSLERINIPTGVTSIGDHAFYDCSSLESINIPASVTSIGDYPFSWCGNLTSITVDVQNSAYSSTEGILFNKDRTVLIQYPAGKQESAYAIPASVTSIQKNAFSGCENLTSITIPEGVTSIGDSAFWMCSSLTSITIPVGVTSIGMGTFSGCESLTSITIPEGVTSIGVIGDGIDGYLADDGAFYWCSSLTSITIPASVTYIGDCTFFGCSNLTSITIPASVTSIGAYAFSECSSLTSITIPANVTSIGDCTFFGCSSLTSITVDNQNYAYSSVDGVLFNKNRTVLIQYPADKQGGSYTIPAGVASIGNSAFSGCNSLTSITTPAI